MDLQNIVPSETALICLILFEEATVLRGIIHGDLSSNVSLM